MSDGNNIFDGDNFNSGNNQNNGQNNSYNQNYNNGYNNGGYNSYQPPFQDLTKPKSKALSVASLVTGIIAVICCCLGWSGIVLGAAAIATAIISRVKLGYFDGMAIAGLVLGIFGFVTGLILVIFTYALGDEFWAEFEKAFWEEYNKMYPEGGGNINGT